MNVKKLEKSGNKSGFMACKWSSLYAPGTENPIFYSGLELGEFPFPIISPWGNKNWPPSMKVEKMEILQDKRSSMEC